MKLDDIPFIAKSVNDEMPVLGEKVAWMKTSQLPKNWFDEASIVNNKFLNNNLASIEETYHCFPELSKSKFLPYQVKTFGVTDMLNHDGFFKGLSDGFLAGTKFSQFVVNPYKYAAGGCTPVSPFATDTANPGNFTLGAGAAYASIATSTGETGNCFNEVSCTRQGGGSGTMNLAMYDHTGSYPGDRESLQTGITTLVNLVYYSIPEGTVDTTTQWVGVRLTVAQTFKRGEANSGQRKYLEPGTLDDPFAAGASNSTQGLVHNVRHV